MYIKIFVLRSTLWSRRWSLAEPVGLNREASLVFLLCLDHVLVGVQSLDVSELTEDSRCTLSSPGGCSSDRNPEGTH